MQRSTSAPSVRLAGRATALVAALSMAAVGSGCADLLGLDDLSFDQRLVEPRVPDASSAGGAAGSSGILIEEPLPQTKAELWGFPALWPGVTIVGAELPSSSAPRAEADRSSSSFHVYEPATGQTTSYRLHADGRDEVVSAWTSGFTLLMPRPSGEGLGLFGYDATGHNELAAPWDPWGQDTSAPLSVEADARQGDPGWTHMTTLRNSGDWLLFIYDAAAGVYGIGPADRQRALDLETAGVRRQWESGWSTLLPYDLGNEDHGLLTFRPETGQAALHQISAQDWELETVLSSEWGAGWTHALSFVAEGEPHVLLYDSTLGRVHRSQLNDALEFESDPEGETYWARNLTSLTVVEFEQDLYVLGYEGATGRARLYSLFPLDPADLIIIR